MPNEKRVVRQLAASVYNAETKEAELGLPINFTQNIYMDSSLEKTLDEALSEIEQLAQSAGGASTFQYSKTYAELTTLINTKSLQPGAQYLLTDYVTKYRQPYTNKIQTANGVSTVERLVLTAVSESAFNPQCVSLDWPNDIVYYDFNDNKCEDGYTARNGFIQRRIDTKYIVDMPHDWRTMRWARFKATAQTWTGGEVSRGSMYQDGTFLYKAVKSGTPASATDTAYFLQICTSNAYFWSRADTPSGLTFNTTDYAERYTFNASDNSTTKTPTKSTSIIPERIVIQSGALTTDGFTRGLSNNVWGFTTEDNKPCYIFAAPGFYSNTFGSFCRNYTFGSGCYNNTFGTDCRNNTFGSSCSNNTFVERFSYNVFGSDCYNNIFGVIALYNAFESNCYNNILKSGCYSNKFASSCYNNTLESGSYNVFGVGCQDNITGSRFSSNTFGALCYRNTIGSDVAGNIFGSQVFDNIIANNLCYSTFEPGIKNKNISVRGRIFTDSTGSVYAVNYVGTTPTYTAIP